MGVTDKCSLRPVTLADDQALEAFVLEHPEHSPGHRRVFAALERVFHHRELSIIAESAGRIVGYAPAFLVHERVLRKLRLGTVVGGSLVGCGPLVAAAASEKERVAVWAGLAHAVQNVTRDAGAHWLRYVFSPLAGDEESLTRHRPFPLLPLGFSLRTICSAVIDLHCSEQSLSMNVSASTRRRIRLAARDGVEFVLMDGTAAWEAIQPFRSLAFKAFGEIERATEGFDALGSLFAPPDRGHPVAHAVVVQRDQQRLAAVVTVESNGTTYAFLAFNTEAALDSHANRLALWQAILAAKNRGNRWFQLGSIDFGDSKAARISDFKRKFGGDIMLSPVAEWCARPVAVAATQLAQQCVSRVRGR